jgi:hypothetical protein
VDHSAQILSCRRGTQPSVQVQAPIPDERPRDQPWSSPFTTPTELTPWLRPETRLRCRRRRCNPGVCARPSSAAAIFSTTTTSLAMHRAPPPSALSLRPTSTPRRKFAGPSPGGLHRKGPWVSERTTRSRGPPIRDPARSNQLLTCSTTKDRKAFGRATWSAARTWPGQELRRLFRFANATRTTQQTASRVGRGFNRSASARDNWGDLENEALKQAKTGEARCSRGRCCANDRSFMASTRAADRRQIPGVLKGRQRRPGPVDVRSCCGRDSQTWTRAAVSSRPAVHGSHRELRRSCGAFPKAIHDAIAHLATGSAAQRRWCRSRLAATDIARRERAPTRWPPSAPSRTSRRRRPPPRRRRVPARSIP